MTIPYVDGKPDAGSSTPSAGSVTLAMLANLAANSIIGNNTGSPATPIALTVANVKSLLAYVPADILSGSGIVWDATNLTLALGSAATSANASLAVLANKTVAVPAAGSVWRGLDVQASTLTLTAGGGTAPSLLSTVYFAAPVITQTAGAAYTIPIAATVTIAGPPTAGAGGGASPTLTSALSLSVLSGNCAFGTSGGAPRIGIGTATPSCAINVYTTEPSQLRLFQPSQGGISVGNIGGYSCITCITDQNFGNLPSSLFSDSHGNWGLGMYPVAGVKLAVAAPQTIASATSATWNGINFAASTASITGATAITTATGFNFTTIQAPTIVGDTATCAISFAASLYVSGAPIASTNVAIAKAYAAWIAGLTRIDSTTPNGSVAVVLGAIGPTGANTTVQEWLTIDIHGTTRYLPCF